MEFDLISAVIGFGVGALVVSSKLNSNHQKILDEVYKQFVDFSVLVELRHGTSDKMRKHLQRATSLVSNSESRKKFLKSGE